MVPRIAKSGRSFKSAALYYLHDKKANTCERVTQTFTLNLPTNDADLAWRIMAQTAIDQKHLKRAAGIKATGRKLTKPVYCYSLSWHPDESPDHDHMIKAAKQSLEAIGMAECQALLIVHNDEPHPHIHILVNRVDPMTGKAYSTSQDRLKLSRWAEKYEQEIGRIYCKERVANNQKRRKGHFTKDRKSLSKAKHHRWQFGEHAVNDDQQSPDISLKREFSALPNQIKDFMRPHWRELFNRQSEERHALKCQLSTLRGRFRHALAARRGKRKSSFLSALFTALSSPRGLQRHLLKRQFEERAALDSQSEQLLTEAARHISKQHRDRFNTLAEPQEVSEQDSEDIRSFLNSAFNDRSLENISINPLEPNHKAKRLKDSHNPKPKQRKRERSSGRDRPVK